MTIEELIAYTEFLAAIDHINPQQSRCVASLLRELVAAREELEWFRTREREQPRDQPIGELVFLCSKTVAARLASDNAMAGRPAGGGEG